MEVVAVWLLWQVVIEQAGDGCTVFQQGWLYGVCIRHTLIDDRQLQTALWVDMTVIAELHMLNLVLRICKLSMISFNCSLYHMKEL